MKIRCTICLCLYDRDSEICALMCGHLYHTDCINHWLSSNSSCPSCRMKVQRNKMIGKLYLEFDDTVNSTQEFSDSAHNQLIDVKASLVERNLLVTKLEQDLVQLKETMTLKESEIRKHELAHKEEQILSRTLRKRVSLLESYQDEMNKAKMELESMKQYLTSLKNVEEVVKGTEADVADLIQEQGEGQASGKQLATYCVILKRELEILKKDKRRLKEEIEKLKRTASSNQRDLNANIERIKVLEKEVKLLKSRPSPMTPKPISRLTTDDVTIIHSDVMTPEPIRDRGGVSDDPTSRLEFLPDDEMTDSAGLPTNKRLKITTNSNSSHHNPCQKQSKYTDIDKNSDESVTKGYKISIKGNENKKIRLEPRPNAMLMNFSIMKKQKQNCEGDRVRSGYDGLGSHCKFVQTSKPGIKQTKMSNFFNR